MMDKYNETSTFFPKMQRQMEEISNEENQTLIKLFRGRIRGGFLIKMKDQVVKTLGSRIFDLFDIKITTENLLTGGDNVIPYEICNHITGIHRANTVFLTQEEREKKERDSEYRETLLHQVVENLVLRGYGSAYFRRKEVIPSDRFIYYPVPYELWVMCLRINQIILTKGAKSQYDLFYSLIMNKSLAALSLLEDNFLDSAYTLCRTVVELYSKLCLCKLHPEIMTEMFEFSQDDLKKNCCGQGYSKEFLGRYDNRKNKSEHNKVNYLQYGFLDKIAGYHDIVNRAPYTIGGIIKYLGATLADEDSKKFKLLDEFYKNCSAYVHGNVSMAKYPLLHYFEISIILGNVIPDIYKNVCEEHDMDVELQKVDLVAKFERDFSLLKKQYDRKSTELFATSLCKFDLE